MSIHTHTQFNSIENIENIENIEHICVMRVSTGAFFVLLVSLYGNARDSLENKHKHIRRKKSYAHSIRTLNLSSESSRSL